MIFYEVIVSYSSACSLGDNQQVIAVNWKFPGSLIDDITTKSVDIHVFKELDEELLVTWSRIRKWCVPWQDGNHWQIVHFPPKWNFTCKFQLKDQIGLNFLLNHYGLLDWALMLAWFNEFRAYRIASTLETSLECLREFYLMGGGQMSIQRSCTLQYCVKPFKLIQVICYRSQSEVSWHPRMNATANTKCGYLLREPWQKI